VGALRIRIAGHRRSAHRVRAQPHGGMRHDIEKSALEATGVLTL